MLKIVRRVMVILFVFVSSFRYALYEDHLIEEPGGCSIITFLRGLASLAYLSNSSEFSKNSATGNEDFDINYMGCAYSVKNTSILKKESYSRTASQALFIFYSPPNELSYT